MQAEATLAAASAAPTYSWVTRYGHLLLIAPLVVFVTAFMIVPCAIVLKNSFLLRGGMGGWVSLSNYIGVLTDPFYWQIIVRSLRISALATLAAAIVSYPAALYIYFSESRWRRVFLFLVVSPLFLSAIVRTYGWMMIFIPSGALNALLPESMEVSLMRTEFAVTVGLTHIYCPFMILAINASLAKQDKRLLIAAASLGASPIRIFCDVIFPLSVPGLVAGSIIVFAVSMTAFGTPVLLGGSANKTLAFMAYQKNLMLANPYEGGAVAVILVVLSMGVVWLMGIWSRTAFKRLGVS